MLNLMFMCETVKMSVRNLRKSQKGAGVSEYIVVTAAVLVVAGFIMVPGLRTFATTVLTALNTWWTSTVSTRVFPTT